jgi:hypothetical protein
MPDWSERSVANGTEHLVADAIAARDELFAALEQVAPDRLGSPALVGEWGARELVAHLGYWAGHGAELIHAAQQAREPEGNLGSAEIERRNRTVARVAATSELATVLRREAASFESLVRLLAAMDPALLQVAVNGPGTLEQAIVEDGAKHYREHAEALRGAIGT